MLGAALAGGLVAVIGPANALVVDAASFGVSALLLAWAMPAKTREVASDEEVDPAPYLEQLRQGWRFLRSDRVLVGITVMVSLTNLLDLAWAAVLVPVWGLENGGAALRSAPCSRPSPAPPRSGRWSPRPRPTGCPATRRTSSASWSLASPGS